jgi:hypothetical protein
MRASVRLLAVACLFFCLSNFLPRPAAAQQSDEIVAERVLGPRWKQLSRRAGMIFAGTVLASARQGDTATQMPSLETVPAEAAATARPTSGPTPSIELRFCVDEPIAGVEPGQVLTIHEWTGAWSMHRPMSTGQHVLLFLYPPSRLGLTSPVGGSLGQVFLDQTGNNVSQHSLVSRAPITLPIASSGHPRATADSGTVSVRQLERAIRNARNE